MRSKSIDGASRAVIMRTNCWSGHVGTTTPTSFVTSGGSATFGSVNTASATGYGVQLDVAANSGTVNAQCVSDASQFTQLYGGYFGSNLMFGVYANGTATFENTVTAGNTASGTSGLFAISGSASASSASILARNYNASGYLFTGYDSTGASNVTIKADGSASFAGKVTSAATASSDSSTTLATKGYVDDTGGGGGGGAGASAWGYVNNGTLQGGLNINPDSAGNISNPLIGAYDITFTTPMPDSNYSVVATSGLEVTVDATNCTVASKTVNGFRIYINKIVDGTAVNQSFQFSVFATNALPLTGGTGTDAWGAFDGTAGADNSDAGSFNIKSFTRLETGTYQVEFISPMPTNKYAVVTGWVGYTYSTEKTTTGFTLKNYGQVTAGAAWVLYDIADVNFTLNATNAVLPQAFTEAQIQSILDVVAGGLGVGVSGQSWQDVTSSRATGTTYTNSTGNSIQVQVSPAASASMFGSFFVDGVEIASCQSTPSGGGVGWPFSVIVPNGSTYSVTDGGNYTVTKWFELRA
jgi:hypothetical protein